MISGLYAGSFDPPTLGHLDLIERARALVSTLWVGVAVNPSKTPFLADTQRVQLLAADCAQWPNVQVVAYGGATVLYAREHRISVLIRGLRTASDLEHEQVMAEINRSNGMETLFVPCRAGLSHVSSSAVRLAVSANLPVEALTTPRVAAALRQRGQVKG